jgi:hypothetical protein
VREEMVGGGVYVRETLEKETLGNVTVGAWNLNFEFGLGLEVIDWKTRFRGSGRYGLIWS